MANPEHPDFSFDDSPQLFLFTSLTAGSSHIITATSRMETILKANRIPFRVVDLATTDKARQLWSRRSRGKKIPGLVKEGMVLADLPTTEEWNEYGEIKMHLADAKGPTPHYVQAAPATSSAQETKLRESESDKASVKSTASTTSSQHQAHAQQGMLAAEAAAAAAARKNKKSPLPILQKTQTQEVPPKDATTEHNTEHNILPHSEDAVVRDKTPAAAKESEDTTAVAEPKTPMKESHSLEQDEAGDEVKTLNGEEIASSPHSPKPLQPRSQSRTSNSARPGEGDDFDGKGDSTSNATLAHPALTAVAGGGLGSVGGPSGATGASAVGRHSMLRQAQDELEAALRGDERPSSEADKDTASLDTPRLGSAAAATDHTPKQSTDSAAPPTVPAKDSSRPTAPHAHFAAPPPADPATTASTPVQAEATVQEEKRALGEQVEDAAARKASVSAKDGDAAGDSVED